MTCFFLWENFGPMHVDRCEAVASLGKNVIGLELYGRSDTYDWISETGSSFNKVTLFQEGRPRGFALLRALIAFRMQQGRAVWFMSHYDWWEICAFAYVLRVLGDRVFTMGCSKFDDWSRSSTKEYLKKLFFIPYNGVLTSGKRSKEYYKFHGFKDNVLASEFNTVSIERIRKMAARESAPNGTPFEVRHFTIVARLVPKKNLHMAIDAYSHYINLDPMPRELHICGSGPLEDELRAKVKDLNLESNIFFHGFVQTEQVAKFLGTTLSLILPSIEEQFGNVVIEAQAMGLPVLLSDVCGARDRLVRTGVNGFVFETDNPEGLAWFMSLLSKDHALWHRMSLSSLEYAEKGDVAAFAQGVNTLCEGKKNYD